MLDIIYIGTIAYMFVYLGQEGYVFYWYQRLIDKIPFDWLYKPLGGCSKCFAGQAMFWYYIIFREYYFFEHLFFVSVTILYAMILDKLTTYLDE